MNIFKKSLMMGLIFLLLVSFSYSRERFLANVSFIPGFPQNDFKENLNQIGLGGSGYFLYRLKNSPLSVGVSLGVMVYGSESRSEFFSAGIPDVMVDVTTRNYILMTHFLMRLQPRRGQIKPYLDGLVGFNYLWTETGVYDRNGIDQRIASDVNFDDVTWSLGFGGGLMLNVYQKRRRNRASPFAVFADFGFRYLKGGRAEYLKEGSIIRENDYLIYDVSESSTDLLTLRAGLSFVF